MQNFATENLYQTGIKIKELFKMQVPKINSVSFQAKKHSLNKNQLFKVRMLLTRMNNETLSEKTETTFETTITSAIKNRHSKFVDSRLLSERVQPEKQMVGKSMLEMNKTTLVIDNSTGEITDWKKPFLTSWHKIMRKVDQNINFFYDNFYNSSLVKKNRVTLQGFTKKGSELIEQAKRNLNG